MERVERFLDIEYNGDNLRARRILIEDLSLVVLDIDEFGGSTAAIGLRPWDAEELGHWLLASAAIGRQEDQTGNCDLPPAEPLREGV